MLFVGKTDQRQILQLMQEYQKRLSRYISLEIKELPPIKSAKNRSEEEQKRLEGEQILKEIAPQDEAILLDERGKELTSPQLAELLQQKMLTTPRKLLFVIGGPYGFSDEVYRAVPQRLSLSRLTFNHQMVRLFLIEQIYRAFTIIEGHPYHHS